MEVPSERDTDPDIGYLADLESDVVKAYHARMIEINLADGYACAAEGFCPALRAHSAAMKAEGDVIEAAAEFFPEFKRDIYGDLRKRALDLLTGLVVTAPGYVNPLKK